MAAVGGSNVQLPAVKVVSVLIKPSDLVSGPFLDYIKSHPGATILHISDADLRTSPWIISIDANDTLWINLSKHAFEGFGLEGHSTERKRDGIDRYVVKVDLQDENISKQDSKYCARLISCMDRLTTSPVQFTAAFESDAAQNAFAKIFTKQQVSVKKPEISAFEKIIVPAFPDLEIDESDHYDLVEVDLWAGAIFNGCTDVIHQRPTDPFISVCSFDGHSSSIIDVSLSHLDCPIHPKLLLEVLKSMKNYDIVVLRVLGNPDAVVTWDENANRIDDRRDSSHGYLLVMRPSSEKCAILQYASCNLRKA